MVNISYINHLLNEPEIVDPVEVYQSRRFIVPEDEVEFWDFFVKNIYEDYPELKTPGVALDGNIFDKPTHFQFFDTFCAKNSKFDNKQSKSIITLNDVCSSSCVSSETSDICSFSPLDSQNVVSSVIRPFVCTFPGCSKTYTSKNGLDYHLEKGHDGKNTNDEKPFKCNFMGCGVSYKSKNGLKYHLKIRHKIKNNKVSS